MGTNYYAIRDASPPCDHCGRYDEAERLHIGKSSAGWCFALHVIPDRGLTDLPEWMALLSSPGWRIEDEYGRATTVNDLRDIITNRSSSAPPLTDHWRRENHAVQGPTGLARAAIGDNCIGHGSGTWDLIAGEFS